MINQKILKIIQKRKVPKGRKKLDQKTLMTVSPKKKRRKLETDDGGKKSKEVVDDKNLRTKKDTPPKRNSSEISEGVKSDPATNNEGNSYPAKRT